MGDIAGVKEHSMLFKAEMVRARQEGRKTQTRRNITFDNSITDPRVRRDEWHELRWAEAAKGREYPGPKVIIPFWHVPFRDIVVRVYPRIRPGDVIWVKETWSAPHKYDHLPPRLIDKDARLHYAASENLGGMIKRSSMLMPRWASRTDLDVIRVGSQRVQEISHDDMCAEGVERVGHSRLSGCSLYAFDDNVDPKLHHTTSNNGTYDTARMAFAALWDSINAAKGFGWDVNHPVWIYEWPAK